MSALALDPINILLKILFYRQGITKSMSPVSPTMIRDDSFFSFRKPNFDYNVIKWWKCTAYTNMIL